MNKSFAPWAAATALLACIAPGSAAAHTGGALDSHGCHDDRRRGEFHCHHGDLRGRSFTSRAAMLDAVESGTLPPRKQSKGFLSRWLPGGDDTDDHGAAQSARPAPEADSPAQARPMPQAADDRDRDMSAAPAAAEEAQDRPALETGRTPETATPHPSAGAPPRAPAADEPRPVSGRGPEARPVAPATGRERSFEERLEILSRLRDKGLITDEEYRARRRAILDEI